MITITFKGVKHELTMDITCLDLDTILCNPDSTWKLLETFNRNVTNLTKSHE